MNLMHCNNCGKQGHVYNDCRIPITSYGVIAFRYNPFLKENQYLMVCRNNSFGFIDFMRGKYSVYNKHYIKNLIKQMTKEEIKNIKIMTFEQLWHHLWNIPDTTIVSNNNTINNNTINNNTINNNTINNIHHEKHEKLFNTTSQTIYRNEEISAKEKFELLKKGVVVSNLKGIFDTTTKNTLLFRGNSSTNDFQLSPFFTETNPGGIETMNKRDEPEKYSIYSIIQECSEYEQWDEPEWGFPKGRRNHQEKDYDTAIREFTEETGVSQTYLKNIQNIYPFEENIMGSNYKSYKHKYYLMYIDYMDSLKTLPFEKNEISKVEWKTFHECNDCIRFYNLEKKRIILNIHQSLMKYALYI